jgi:hypothetical protein
LTLGAAITAPYAYPDYYAPPAYSQPAYASPAAVYPQAPTYAAPQAPPAVQREVVFPNGKYVLYGDGVTQPGSPVTTTPRVPTGADLRHARARSGRLQRGPVDHRHAAEDAVEVGWIALRHGDSWGTPESGKGAAGVTADIGISRSG